VEEAEREKKWRFMKG